MTKPLVQTVGRRKSSIVRVQLRDGTGLMTLNDRPLENYFPNMAQRIRVLEPMRITGVDGRYDVKARLEGGGLTGQSDALRLGIARALVSVEPELRPTLKKAGMLTRDARAVERKKYGLKKARRAEQFTKR
ncbi:MAG: 30S ribosomal protein S9 [Actinobacteria bacterium]|jgi:small subunit ribosomal protein S9|nr:30S ribosomal protein S9 [Actinomycetota bacterium]MBU1492583.1 30S ribosomal protein S9 [Actinomycetota bacterium]